MKKKEILIKYKKPLKLLNIYFFNLFIKWLSH